MILQVNFFITSKKGETVTRRKAGRDASQIQVYTLTCLFRSGRVRKVRISVTREKGEIVARIKFGSYLLNLRCSCLPVCVGQVGSER